MAAFLFLYLLFWGGKLPFSPLNFTFHISTCIPSGVLTPLAKNKEKFMSSKALIMIPKILLERRMEMSIKGGVPCVLWVLKGVGHGVDAGFINQCIPLNKIIEIRDL